MFYQRNYYLVGNLVNFVLVSKCKEKRNDLFQEFFYALISNLAGLVSKSEHKVQCIKILGKLFVKQYSIGTFFKNEEKFCKKKKRNRYLLIWAKKK